MIFSQALRPEKSAALIFVVQIKVNGNYMVTNKTSSLLDSPRNNEFTTDQELQ